METIVTRHKNILPGYQIGKMQYKSSRSVYLLGHDLAEKNRVLIRFLKKKQPAAEEISRFQDEYELLRELSGMESIPRPLHMEETVYGLTMVLEYFDGLLLPDVIAAIHSEQKSIDSIFGHDVADPVNAFLLFAIPMTRFIDNFHSKGLVHQKIHPEDIVWEPRTGRVMIIDFSGSEKLTRLQDNNTHRDISTGNLAYIAPEQTGRINRSVDLRTDFYAMGVTFYEMLTGSLPFAADDAMKLVHSHIAMTPEAPHTINPSVPPVISSIILKLMAKNPENRYQSAHGLLMDLQECRKQLQAKTEITDYEIGQADIADKLKAPQKLYGRDGELKELLDTFERVAAGSRETIFVTGDAGIGKSRLVEKLRHQVRDKNGFFITCEFDRFKRDIPYTPLLQGFKELIQQILTKEEPFILKWRNILLDELGANCRVLIDVIPELVLITGDQAPLPELSTDESKKRFHLAISRFVKICATAEHPLVIFLDNLQWVDTASLNLIEAILKSSEINFCLGIGAYRDTEIKKDHALVLFSDALNAAGINIDLIHLTALKMPPVNQLIADSLMVTPDITLELSKLVNKKSGGNPFFIFQFIKSLYEKNLITYDGAWQFNMAAISQTDITENMAAFMADHLQRLPENVQKTLKIAACIGIEFDSDLISKAMKKSEATVSEELAQAIHEGLLVSLDDGVKFSHNRVRDAAYSLLDKNSRVKNHHAIGNAMLAGRDTNWINQNIFEVVHQLNQAIDLISDPAERTDLAELNLKAGIKAKAAAAYLASRQYLKLAMALLTDTSWADAYPLTLKIYNANCEIGYLTGDHATADKYYDEVLEHARNPFDKVKVLEVKITMYTGANQPAKAIELGIESLHMLGVGFPKKATTIGVIRELLRVKWLLRNKTMDDLLNLPEMNDTKTMAIARILMLCTEPSYVENPTFLVIAVLKLLALTVKHGNSIYSAFAFATYGALLCGAFGNYDKGREYAELALKSIDKFNAAQLKAKVSFLIGGGIHHWTKPLKEDLAYHLEAYNCGVDTGDHSFAAYGVTCYMYAMFFLGEPLEKVDEKFQNFTDPMEKLHQESSFQEFLIWHQLVKNLQTDPDDPLLINGSICDAKTYISQWQEVNDLNRLGIANIAKMILHYLFDDMEEVIKHAKTGKQYLEAIMGQIFVSEYYFYYSLALLAVCLEADKWPRLRYMKQIRANQKKLKKWALHAPENFEHQYLMIGAGIAAVEGAFEKAMILFNSAINTAGRNGFLQDQAIANELAGKIWFKAGNNQIANIFMSRAYRCYQRWGAISKTLRLEKIHPQLLNETKKEFPPALEKGFSGQITGKSDQVDMMELDVMTVIQAAQTLSEEIILDKLINQLVRMNIETAGAEKGVLLLKKDDRFIVEAVGKAVKDAIDVGPSKKPISDQVPVSLIRFVARTEKTVVLADAAAEDLFSEDPYMIRHSPKSIICIPVLHQQHLTAVMYLENNLSEGIFTPKRQKILKVLASQAAISIDNAILYEELADAEQRLSNLLKTANEGFLAIDTNAVITDVNPEMCRILGRKRDKVIGAKYLDLPDQKDAEMIKNQLALRRKGKKGAYDITFKRPEGSTVDCLVKAAPLFDKLNHFIGSFAMITDITERKHAEKELMLLNQELEQRVTQRTAELEESLETLKRAQDHLIQSEKMAALGGLVAGVAHEINTPVGIGVTAISFLEEKLNQLNELFKSGNLSKENFEKNIENAMDAASTTHKNLKRAVALIGSFKEVAADQASEEQRRFNVKDYIDEVLLSLRPKYKRTMHSITAFCPEDLEINSYPGAFSQIITNLVINSLTHAFEGIDSGEMEIRVTMEEQQLIFQYRDNGVGMNHESAVKIFDPFFTTRRSAGGTGLGMYIVYNIVTQTLGGRIDCVTEPDQGMVITIKIPMEDL